MCTCKVLYDNRTIFNFLNNFVPLKSSKSLVVLKNFVQFDSCKFVKQMETKLLILIFSVSRFCDFIFQAMITFDLGMRWPDTHEFLF